MTAFCWFVRAGQNEELRYSIRSVHTHFPDAPLFIVGDKPDWVTGVGFLKGNPTRTKHLNVWKNLEALAAWDEVPDDIVIMNDDFYITAPLTVIPMLYRGTLEDHIESLNSRVDWWLRSLHNTRRYLASRGITNPISYELHTPFPASRVKLREALTLAPRSSAYFRDPPQWRTVYGNVHSVPATLAPDVKVKREIRQRLPRPFASSSDTTFTFAWDQLRRLYPDPSPFES